MALTTAVEMLLQNANLVNEFEKQRPLWLTMAGDAYAYTAKTVPRNPRRDDVAPHVALALESNDDFLRIRSDKGINAKYWLRHFADLIVDRLWDELESENEGGSQ